MVRTVWGSSLRSDEAIWREGLYALANRNRAMSLQSEYEKEKLLLYREIRELTSGSKTSQLESLYDILVKLRNTEVSVHTNFVLHPFLRLHKHVNGKDLIGLTCRSNNLFEYFCRLFDKVSRYKHTGVIDRNGLISKSKCIMYYIER